MANDTSALNPENWRPMIQDYLNAMLVSTEICNTKFEAELKDGDQVNFPYVSDVRIQDYVQGTDVDIDSIVAAQSSLIVNQSKIAAFAMDPVQERQAKASYGSELAYQSAFQLKNNIDQKNIATGIAGAAETVAGGSLSTSTILGKMGDVYSELFRSNATDGELFGVIDTERSVLLTETFVSNGFVEADAQLRNQFRGRAAGFDIYVSNNLPSAVTLTTDTQPTAGNTFTILGGTWTCVTDGTAAAAGEINIGADVADWKTIIVKAINGTTSTDYVDLATSRRRKYQNAQLAAATFVGDDCALTAYGKIGGAETFTAVTNVFGTETSNMLFGRKGAISLGMQMAPELYIREESKQLARNYMTHTLFGSKVFTRDEERLVKMSINV